jgi:hypothetical protein
MTSPSVHLGPSSWDRDMQGLDVDDESENLAALGMHVTGAKDPDEKDEDEDEVDGKDIEKVVGAEPVAEAEEEEKKPEDEPEELDELKELDRLESQLKAEDDPVAMVDDED